MTSAGRKPNVPRNASDVKTDFSRVYFQNVRLLLAGAIKKQESGTNPTLLLLRLI